MGTEYPAGQLYRPFCVAKPSFKDAAATKGLNVEPAGYRPCVARSRNGSL